MTNEQLQKANELNGRIINISELIELVRDFQKHPDAPGFYGKFLRFDTLCRKVFAPERYRDFLAGLKEDAERLKQSAIDDLAVL